MSILAWQQSDRDAESRGLLFSEQLLADAYKPDHIRCVVCAADADFKYRALDALLNKCVKRKNRKKLKIRGHRQFALF